LSTKRRERDILDTRKKVGGLLRVAGKLRKGEEDGRGSRHKRDEGLEQPEGVGKAVLVKRSAIWGKTERSRIGMGSWECTCAESTRMPKEVSGGEEASCEKGTSSITGEEERGKN